jgi:hypothetical protein
MGTLLGKDTSAISFCPALEGHSFDYRVHEINLNDQADDAHRGERFLGHLPLNDSCFHKLEHPELKCRRSYVVVPGPRYWTVEAFRDECGAIVDC